MATRGAMAGWRAIVVVVGFVDGGGRRVVHALAVGKGGRNGGEWGIKLPRHSQPATKWRKKPDYWRVT